MNRSFFIGFTLAVVLVVCGWLTYCAMFSGEELASKVEWSILQSVVWQHRAKSSNNIEIVRMEDYSLAGIPVKDARREIWIMLNAKNPPYYKQFPLGHFQLTKQDFKTIITSNPVSSTVENCLESHIEAP